MKTWTPLALLACLASCHTVVQVRRVEHGDHQPGLRYSLPQPFLVATPQADGKLSYGWEYLADRDQTYAINAYSVLGRHKLTVKTSHGLLTLVDLDGASDQAASDLVKAVGEVEKARIEAEVKAAAEQQEADGEVLEAYQDALRDYQVAQAKLQAVLRTFGPGSPEQQAAAAEVAEAEATLKFYRELLGQSGGDAFDGAAFDGGAEGEASQFPQLTGHPGPVWFRLVEGPSGVLKLVALEFPAPGQTGPQPEFPVYTVKPPPGGSGGGAGGKIEVETKELKLSSSAIGKVFSIKLKTPVQSLGSATLNFEANSTLIEGSKYALELDSEKVLEFKLKVALPPGRYLLAFNAKTKDGKTGSGLVTVDVVHGL